MRGKAYILLIILFVSLLSSCASVPPSGEQFSAVRPTNQDKALVYLYRPHLYYGEVFTYAVLLNNKKIADLGDKGFFAIELDAGSYSIHTDTPVIDPDLVVNLENGTTTFLRLKVDDPMLCVGFCTTIQFEVVNERKALHELKGTREEVKRVYFK